MKTVENPKKQLKLQENNTGKITFMPPAGYRTAGNILKNWDVVGKEQPSGVLKTWYVDEEEKNKATLGCRPFCNSIMADSYFKITERIDSQFIEGYLGHPRIDTYFFTEIQREFTYFDDYVARKKIYFTFDQISLFQVIQIYPENPVRLIMKQLDSIPVFKPNTAFMLMPFHNSVLNDFYKTRIQPFLKDKFGISIYRADDFTNNDIIIETIYSQIDQSEFIIADITEPNKNVFYELGYAAAKGKEIITLLQKVGEFNFFDRNHIRSIVYDFNEIEKFYTELQGTIQSIRLRQ